MRHLIAVAEFENSFDLSTYLRANANGQKFSQPVANGRPHKSNVILLLLHIVARGFGHVVDA